jgi:hypothetical protein
MGAGRLDRFTPFRKASLLMLLGFADLGYAGYRGRSSTVAAALCGANLRFARQSGSKEQRGD